MSERTNRGFEGSLENLMKFFGKEEWMGVDESSERFLGVVSRLFRGHRAIVVCDVFALIFPTCDEGRVEKWSGFGV